MSTISPSDLSHRIALGEAVRLLDVRTPGEFDSAHVEDSVLMPSDTFDADVLGQHIGTDEQVIVICQKGPRASAVIRKMQGAGYQSLTKLDGGVAAWIESGHPIVEGGGAIGLDRQMRITAGLLILLGMALGTWVHAGFYGLSAFIGAGLIFAGVTDLCPMTSVIARMPWNRAGGPSRTALLKSTTSSSGEACSAEGGG